jgi:hypothetical protein
MSLIDKIILGIGAALALAVMICVLWLIVANAHLKTQLAQAQANDTACHLANDEFTAQIARQNQAVEKLRIASEAREKRAQEAALDAQKTARGYLAAAAKLAKAGAGGDACRSANKLLDSYLGATR